MEKRKDPKQLMEEGWKSRENLNFEQAEKKLTKAKKLFEEQEDFYNASECLNHLSILKKMRGMELLREAVRLGLESLKLNEEKGNKTILSKRAVASSLKTLGEFEKAEKYIKAVVENMKENSTARSEMRTDLAFNLMRRGKINEAKEQIELAQKELEEGWENERFPHKVIWKTKLLNYRSLIEYNLGNIDIAKELAEEMHKLAKENDLKTRLEEAKSLLELF